jgi:hypothetical protein
MPLFLAPVLFVDKDAASKLKPAVKGHPDAKEGDIIVRSSEKIPVSDARFAHELLTDAQLAKWFPDQGKLEWGYNNKSIALPPGWIMLYVVYKHNASHKREHGQAEADMHVVGAVHLYHNADD